MSNTINSGPHSTGLGLLTTVTGPGSYITTSTNNTKLRAAVVDNTAMTVEQSGRLELKGKQADLVINGVSLSATLKGIQERLNILTVDPDLERQWNQLRELGEQYRKLESEILQKQRMWETLQK